MCCDYTVFIRLWHPVVTPQWRWCSQKTLLLHNHSGLDFWASFHNKDIIHKAAWQSFLLPCIVSPHPLQYSQCLTLHKKHCFWHLAQCGWAQLIKHILVSYYSVKMRSYNGQRDCLVASRHFAHCPKAVATARASGSTELKQDIVVLFLMLGESLAYSETQLN